MSAGKSDDAPIRWGILGAANIAVKLVVPAMQQSAGTRIAAIASRTLAKAQAAARELGIPTAYGSYEALIADPDIDAIYNPLPNHLHVPWTIKAAEAGKHVLCEKPIALNADEARSLIAVQRTTGVQIAEAFMVRAHPRWHGVRDMIRQGKLGTLKLMEGHFSYYRRDPTDVRSKVEWGGGVLMDIACYPITISRWLFGAEPEAVIALIERDPDFKVDRLVSGMLRYPDGQASFSVGGQLASWQRVQLFGDKGRIDVEAPFNTPGQYDGRIVLDQRQSGGTMETIDFPAVNQYQLQGERFNDAIRGRGMVPVPVEDAVANMAVMDALFRSAESGRWEAPAR